jgi:hypothetical protein
VRGGLLEPQPLEKAQSIMCIHAEQDQPRPRRCVELHAPCEECAEAEQEKMDQLAWEHVAKLVRQHTRAALIPIKVTSND